MAVATVFYWIVKGNKNVIVEAGTKAAAALRAAGARKATKQEVLDMPARRRRITVSEAKKIAPSKLRKTPTPRKPSPSKLTPEQQAQADRWRSLGEKAGVPITSEAEAKAFESFAKGGLSRRWATLSPGKKKMLAAGAGFATAAGLYAWLRTGEGKPDPAAVKRKRAKQPWNVPVKKIYYGQQTAKPKPGVVPRGTVSKGGITKYPSGSFNTAFAKERKKAMAAGEPDTGEFYWKGNKYTTKIKSRKPPEDTSESKRNIPYSRAHLTKGIGTLKKIQTTQKDQPPEASWRQISGPTDLSPAKRVYKTPFGDITVDSSPDVFKYEISGDKHGGQIKKSLKKDKVRGRKKGGQVKPRGVGVATHGYGKAMKIV